MAEDHSTARVAAASLDAVAGLDQLEAASLAPDPYAARGRSLAGRSWAILWPKLLAIAIVLAIWEILYLAHWKRLIFPGPSSTLSTLGSSLGGSELWHAIGITMLTAVEGFAMALVIGVVVGGLVARVKPLRAAVGSMITALQTMPSIAWFPFAIILFGLSREAILFVVVLDSAPSIANGLISGIDYTPPLLIKAGQQMGLRRVALYRFLILPAALPTFLAGLRQSWAFAWRSLLAGELYVLVAGQVSLGVLLSTDQDQADMQGAISIMIVILIIGVVVDSVFRAIDQRVRVNRGLAPPDSLTTPRTRPGRRLTPG
jgi:NitT/TauT family transport system permease protein